MGTIKELFGLPSFLTKRDEWSGKFTSLFTELDQPRDDCPMHLPDAPAPGAWSRVARGLARRVRGGDREDDDDDDDDDLDVGDDGDGDSCDEPSRRQRRSIQITEELLGISSPPHLHRCAHAEPHWLNRCPGVSRRDASEWLQHSTEEWLRRRRRRRRLEEK